MPPSDVRSKILSVSTHLFAERGFAATSLQAVAEDVGIRKQSVLHHFSSKEELRRAVLGQLLEHWNETLPQILVAVSDDNDRLEAILTTVLNFFAEDPDRARLLQREILDRPDEMRVVLGEHTRMWITMIADAIKGGIESGAVWSDVDAETYILDMAVLMISGLGGLRATDVMIDPTGAFDAKEKFTKELLRLAKRGLFVPEGTE